MGIDWATDPEYSSIKVTRSEVIVTDPGKFTLFASGSISEKYPNSKDVDFNISLGVIGADSPVLIRTSTSCQGFSEGTFFQKRMKRRESLPQTDELES